MSEKNKAFFRAIPSVVVAVLSMAICAGLGIASLFVLANMQVQNFDMEISEVLSIGKRNPLHSVAGTLLVAVLLMTMSLAARRYLTWKTARILTVMAAAGNILLCFCWMYSFRAEASADQAITWAVAQELASPSGLADWQIDYVKIHPYQAGTAMVMELFIRLFGRDCYSWLTFSALCAGGCVAVLSCLCGRITDSPSAKSLCAVLLASFFPLAMYSSFVYGTIPGIFFAVLGLYVVVRQCSDTDHPIRWCISGILAFSTAIILYTGEQIFLVAGVIVLFFTGISHHGQHRKISAAVLLGVFAVGLCNGWQAIAMHRLGLPNDPGCPILPRILMGVDAYSENPAPGFYNGICLSVFRECNYDARLANLVSIGHIKNSLLALHEQGRFVKFFAEKTADQWLEPWFSALSMANPAIYNEPNQLAQAVAGGKLFAPIQAWLSLLLSFIYLFGALGTVVLAKRERTALWRLILEVCLIGGFLFQLVYETKARYCMPYYLCCFPIAAAGLSWGIHKIGGKIGKNLSDDEK